MIVDRPLNDRVPDHYEPDRHLHIELYDPARQFYHPLGIAFVTVFPTQVNLDALFVFDQFRNRGIGTQLLRACRYRWPGLLLTPEVAEFAAHIDSKIDRTQFWIRAACGEGRQQFQ